MQQRLKRQGVGRVSGKPSAHTRGMAADIGPPSQYNWLVANASKYGLKSGVNQGEPWHVGMGDLPPGWNPVAEAPPNELFGFEGYGGGIFDIISGLLQVMKDRGQTDASVEGMAKIVPSFLNLLSGAIAGGKEYDASALAFRGEELYNKLSVLSKDISLGGIMAPTNQFGQDVRSQPTTITPGGYGASISPDIPYSGPGASYFASGNAAQRAAATAAVLYQAGFRGSVLESLTAIAGRESDWTPTAHRTDTVPKQITSGDRGLMQINYVHDTGLIGAGIINQSADLLNPLTNARAAYFVSGGNSLGPWSMGSGGWTSGGDPMYGAKVETAQAGLAAARAQGWIGDLVPLAADTATRSVDLDYMLASIPKHDKEVQGMTFQNTFVLQMGSGGNGGGIDLRRTASTIADHLENEMRQRAVRMN